MEFFKHPLFFALAAAAVVWWLLRRKADCHCDDTQAQPAGAPPIATNPWATNAPPPASSGDLGPPPVGPSTPTPAVRDSDLCTTSGGSWGWDPTLNAGFCAYPETATPVRGAIWSGVDPAACRLYGGVVTQGGGCTHCGSLGGQTLPDGSCCIASQGCDPTARTIAPPPVSPVAPTPVWGGYDGLRLDVPTGPPAADLPKGELQRSCERTGGLWWRHNDGTGHCVCSAGDVVNPSGNCATAIG